MGPEGDGGGGEMTRRRKRKPRDGAVTQPDLLKEAGLESAQSRDSEAPAWDEAPEEPVPEDDEETGSEVREMGEAPSEHGGQSPGDEVPAEPGPPSDAVAEADPEEAPFRLEPEPPPPPRPARRPRDAAVPRWERRVAELEDLGDLEQALEVVRGAQESSPGDVHILLKEIHLLGSLGRFDEAEEPLRILRLAEGSSLEVRRAAGILQFRRGTYSEAETELRAAVKIGDPSGQSHYYLGEALNRMGRVDEALKVLSQAVDLNPLESRAYSTLGRLLDRKGLPEEAAVMYRRARETAR